MGVGGGAGIQLWCSVAVGQWEQWHQQRQKQQKLQLQTAKCVATTLGANEAGAGAASLGPEL